MKIVEINKEQLNGFVAAQKQAQFLQSWEWGELQEREGKRILRFGFEDEGGLFFVLTLNVNKLFTGKTYLYAPRVNVSGLSEEQLRFILNELKKVAQKEKAIFLRFESTSQMSNVKCQMSIVKSIDWQPRQTLILDLNQSEEELLKAMHQKTRYNIRLAEKRGVEIIEDNNRFADFWNLMKTTGARDEFRIHGKKHYEELLNIQYPISNIQSISNNQLSIKLLLAKYSNKVIASGVFAFFGDMATYMHGASSNEYRNVMAPFLIQWTAIKKAQELGLKYYDFHGVDEKKWPGVTRFKMGFGGEVVEYPGTQDMIFSSVWYWVYGILRKVRRMF